MTELTTNFTFALLEVQMTYTKLVTDIFAAPIRRRAAPTATALKPVGPPPTLALRAPAVEATQAERPISVASVVEAFPVATVEVAELPAVEAVAELPVVEAVAEVPVAEVPVAESPVAEAVPEVPAVEAALEVPVAELPVVEALAEFPAVEAVAELPAVEAVAELPAVETIAEVPVAELPVVEALAELPVVEALAELPAVEATAADVSEAGRARAVEVIPSVRGDDAPSTPEISPKKPLSAPFSSANAAAKAPQKATPANDRRTGKRKK